MINAFLFDLGRVLLQFDHRRAAEALAPYAKTDPDKLYDAFFESPIQVLHDQGKVTGDQFYQQITQELGISIDQNQFLECWNDIFSEDPRMEAWVDQLKDRFPLFGISNTNRLHFEYVYKRYPVIQKIQKWVLSYEVGTVKPDPAIYYKAIRLIGQPPEKIFYVDDRLELVEAASKLGLQSWQFTGADAFGQKLQELGAQ